MRSPDGRGGDPEEANPGPGRASRGPAPWNRQRNWQRSRESKGSRWDGLADATGIAKRGVYALFGSKEELQLATINAVRDSFIIEVVAPALNATEPGRQRRLALCEGFLSYVERRFPGWMLLRLRLRRRVGGRPGVSTTRSLVSNSGGEVCSDAKPAWPLIEASRPLTRIPRTPPLSRSRYPGWNEIVSVLHDDLAVIGRARSAVKSRLSSKDMT